MSALLLLALMAAPESVAEDCPGGGKSAAEDGGMGVCEYLSPAAPGGKAEFDTSRRFYFDARKKMTAADFDAFLASIGARVVAADEALAHGEAPVAAQEASEPAAATTVAVTADAARAPSTPDSAAAGSAAIVENAAPASVKPLRVGR